MTDKTMKDCSKISKDLALAACGSSTAAIEADIILFRHDDIDTAESSVDGNVASAIVLKEGKYAVRITGEDNSFETDATLNVGTYRRSFVHKVVFRSFLKSQDVKNEVTALANDRVVAIVKNLDNRSTETKYEVYGWDGGLKMSEFSAPSTDADGVMYNYTLTSTDNAREGQLPLSFYAGSLESTETALRSLLKTT